MCVCVRLSNLIACVLYLFISFADKYKQDYLILGLPDKQRHVGTEFISTILLFLNPIIFTFLSSVFVFVLYCVQKLLLSNQDFKATL